MIKAIIIDDEQHCIEQLETLLRQHCAQTLAVYGRFTTIEEGLEGLTAIGPDLVFLDVMIHDKTGFDLLRALPSVDFEVIFTTAFDQFAVEAFRFSALDYLLKPVNPEELVSAVDKLRKRSEPLLSSAQLSALLNNLKKEGQNKRLAVPTMQGIDFLPLDSIIRCESESNYTILYLKDHRKITVAKTLRYFEDLLLPYDFCRVHHSHIVNLREVKSYSRTKTGALIMSDNSTVEVASRRKDEFMRRMLG